jgi:hypothetical protein
MSGKSTAAVSHQAAHASVSAATRPAVSKSDASARWAALDSRHERLVTATDAVLAEPDRKSDHRMAS